MHSVILCVIGIISMTYLYSKDILSLYTYLISMAVLVYGLLSPISIENPFSKLVNTSQERVNNIDKNIADINNKIKKIEKAVVDYNNLLSYNNCSYFETIYTPEDDKVKLTNKDIAKISLKYDPNDIDKTYNNYVTTTSSAIICAPSSNTISSATIYTPSEYNTSPATFVLTSLKANKQEEVINKSPNQQEVINKLYGGNLCDKINMGLCKIYKNIIDWNVISKKKINQEFFDTFKDKLNVNEVFIYNDDNIRNMLVENEKLDWGYICEKYDSIDQIFIDTYINNIKWDHLVKNQNLDMDIVVENFDKFNILELKKILLSSPGSMHRYKKIILQNFDNLELNEDELIKLQNELI